MEVNSVVLKDSSNLSIENRKKLSVTGVVEVIRFNDEEINFKTKLGKLTIKGHDLRMNKLDVQNGEVIVTGRIDICQYSNLRKRRFKFISRGKK